MSTTSTSTTRSGRPAYQYKALAPNRSSFRIVYLMPGLQDSPLECDILEIPTNARSDFSALSYACGDPAVVDHVLVRGRTIGIGRNLADALQSLRRPDWPRALWIDALCINQIDTVEKSEQIPFMTHIYGNTKLVTIWLGLQENGSEGIPKLCHRVLEAFEKSGVQMEPGKRPSDAHSFAKDHYSQHELPVPTDKRWDWFRALLSRPWFTRIWIFQEAVLARETDVVCGQWTMPFNILTYTIYVATVLDLPVFPKPNVQSRTTAIRFMSFMQWLRGKLSNQQTKSERPKLIHLLDRCRIASATDAHDYCYSLMGLARDGTQDFVRPDYGLSVPEDYLRFAQYFVRENDGIVVLYNAGRNRQTLRLPSWVPDWSHREGDAIQLNPNPLAKPETTRIYQTASHTESSVRLALARANALVVSGIMFDTIGRLGKIHVLDRQISPERSRLIFSSAHESLQQQHAVLNPHEEDILLWKILDVQWLSGILRDTQELLQGYQQKAYPTAEDIDTVIWKTLICNASGQSGQRAPDSHGDLYRAFKQIIPLYVRDWPKADMESLVKAISRDRDRAQIVANATRFAQLAAGACDGRRICRTERGYVGQVPLSSQVGDKLFVPLGSAIPFVVRQYGSRVDEYELIGECYIHGIMNGELFATRSIEVKDVVFV